MDEKFEELEARYRFVDDDELDNVDYTEGNGDAVSRSSESDQNENVELLEKSAEDIFEEETVARLLVGQFHPAASTSVIKQFVKEWLYIFVIRL